MALVFISYRRNDSSAHALAIRDRLAGQLGPNSVFLDVERIEPGDDFVSQIGEHLEDCKVCLVIIGSNWNAGTASGGRLLDRPSDFVRMEVGAALAKPGVRVVPLLLDGMSMPTEAELPRELKRLTRLSAIELDFRRAFPAAAQDLIDRVSRWLAQPAPNESLRAPGSPEGATVVPMPKWVEQAGSDPSGQWADIVVAGVRQRFRLVEPGQFFMGAGRREAGHRESEEPSHPVVLTDAFWLADTACTQALWHAVLKERPSRFDASPEHPVESVSWNDIVERFLPALEAVLPKAKLGLPTEAEWEYSCRAGSQRAYTWGDVLSASDANFEPGRSEAVPIGPGRTCPVKQYRANAFGLYQMHGNVWEWCDDAPRDYESAMVTNPHGGHDGLLRAVRGGSWNNNAARARSASRRAIDRSYCRPFIGFRVKAKR